MPTVTGRVRHYGSFYRIDDEPAPGAGPTVLVYGNCQAEALRVLLAASSSSPVRTIRVPPVFELEAADLPYLQRAAADARILVSQPVSDDYRDLPLGTRQVAALMPAGSSVLRWPVVRFAGLHPWQAIVRHPLEPSREPPVVPYHDLRTLMWARSGLDRRLEPPPSGSILAVGDASRAELRRREQRDCDLAVSDLFARPQPADVATINHPGNRILMELAARVQSAIGYAPDVQDPGRTLLGQVVAPVEGLVAQALGIPAAASDAWSVGGAATAAVEIQQRQLRWYADNPAVVEAGWLRHRATIELLGLA